MYLVKVGKEEAVSGNPAGGILAMFPSVKVLDDINYKAIMVGFPMLTLGIITGAAWANYAWGTYWSWDPKETWSLIVWFIYAAFLHARFTRGWVGRRAAWLSILGFAATVFCYLGVNLLLSGLHSYGG
jgi:cytochrome c-type biogenesis protein CcsB